MAKSRYWGGWGYGSYYPSYYWRPARPYLYVRPSYSYGRIGCATCPYYGGYTPLWWY
jgi:hypothetical protein